MKCICDKIILVTKYENCIHTSKLGSWVKFCVVTIIDINQLNLGLFGGLTFLVESSLKICVFFIFSTIKAKYFMYLKKKINIK
jgi:hypothetical protein